MKLAKLGCYIALGALSGCSTYAAPNLIGGKYYLAGDKQCVNAQQSPLGDYIECYNKKGQQTVVRWAMNENDMQQYQLDTAYRRQQTQNLTQQLYDVGKSLQNSAAQVSSSYQPPMSSPNHSPSNQVQSYRSIGNTIFGPNGIVFNRVGDSLIGNNGVTYRPLVDGMVIGTDGTRCRVVTPFIYCN